MTSSPSGDDHGVALGCGRHHHARSRECFRNAWKHGMACLLNPTLPAARRRRRQAMLQRRPRSTDQRLMEETSRRANRAPCPALSTFPRRAQCARNVTDSSTWPPPDGCRRANHKVKYLRRCGYSFGVPHRAPAAKLRYSSCSLRNAIDPANNEPRHFDGGTAPRPSPRGCCRRCGRHLCPGSPSAVSPGGFVTADTCPMVLAATGKLTLTWAPAVNSTCCVWVTSRPFSFHGVRMS